jgi:phage tail sheath protein FI
MVMSLNQFVADYGNRMSYSILYDCVEEFFREGGARLFISRVVGPAAIAGSVNLMDAATPTPAISLVVTGNGPGSWSSNYSIAVYAVAGGGYGIQVILIATGAVVEDSGPLATQAAAVAWSMYSDYVTIALGASALIPAAAAAAPLSAGNDDRANITDAQWQTALNFFTKDLGPGQLSAPGQTSTTRHSQLVSAAVATGRVALLDLTDSSNPSLLTSNLPPYSTNTRFAAAFAPWVIIPGVTIGSTRTIPPSPLIAGLVARNDPVLGVDAAAAGNQGISNYAIGLSQAAWDDPTRTSLNGSGVNVVRMMAGVIENYGWRSIANPVSDNNWLDFGNARLFVGLSAELNAIAEEYVFQQIDGQNGQTINNFHDALVNALLVHYNDGDLFGDSADTAFLVDTGPSVNTLQTIANLELHAVCQVVMTPFAEYVQIQIVKRQITDPIVTG